MNETQRILVILPAYNEAENIVHTLADIKKLTFTVDVLVVDDGSSDSTAIRAAQAGVAVVSLPFNLGIGGAMQTGFLFALQQGYNVAVQVDADGQHDVHFLQNILDPVWTNTCDLVIGSRFLGPKGSWQSSFVRRIGIRFFSVLISFLTGCPITDPTSGFRAYGPRALQIFAEDYPQDFPEPESIVIARRRGLRLCEVPVEMRQRLSGHSSIRYFKTLYYMIKVTCAILLDMMKRGKYKQP